MHLHTQTRTHTHTHTVHFSMLFFFTPLVTNLATSCNFLIYLQRQAVNSFAVALCLSSYSPPPSRGTQVRPQPSAHSHLNRQVFSQCHRAVKSSQRSLSENFLITTSRSLRTLPLSSLSPRPRPYSLDLFMEQFL